MDVLSRTRVGIIATENGTCLFKCIQECILFEVLNSVTQWELPKMSMLKLSGILGGTCQFQD